MFGQSCQRCVWVTASVTFHWLPLFSDQCIKRWAQLDPDRTYLHTQNGIPRQPKRGRTRADKIGVGAGGDIGGTDISCNFVARQYMGPARQSYRDAHRHVGVIPVTPSINTPARCALVFKVLLRLWRREVFALLFVFVIGIYSYSIKCLASTTR